MYSVQLLCSPCLANVLIRRNYFVTSVANLPQSRKRKCITRVVKKAYELYFGCKVGDQDKSWAPYSCCSRCLRYLRGWLIGTHQSMPFAVPVVWREQKDHLTDCYFCLRKRNGHNSKYKQTSAYLNIPSALMFFKRDDSCQFLWHLNSGPCVHKN